MLLDILNFLLDVVASFFGYLLLLRFVMQWRRVSFKNPLGHFVLQTTNWVVLPLRRAIPGLFGLDFASLHALTRLDRQTEHGARHLGCHGGLAHGLDLPFVGHLSGRMGSLHGHGRQRGTGGRIGTLGHVVHPRREQACCRHCKCSQRYHNRRTELTSSQFGCRDPIWHKSQQVH